MRRVPAVLFVAIALLPPADAASQVRYNNDILEITPAVVSRFITAAQAELQERERIYAGNPRLAEAMKKQACLEAAQPQLERAWNAEDEAAGERMVRDVMARCGFATGAAQQTPHQAWQRCAKPYEAEALRIQTAMREALRAQDRTRATAYRDSMNAIMQQVNGTCGPEPEEDPFNPHGDQQMPDMDPFDGDEDLRSAGDEANAEAERRAPQRGNFTPQQYRIVKERIINYMNVLKHGSGLGDYRYGDGETAAISSAGDQLGPLLVRLGAL